MRRKISAVLMMLLCLLLASCSRMENGIADALTFRESLQAGGGCRFTAQVVTRVEDRGYAFTLDCSYFCDAPTELTVTAPETIRGICAQITDRDAVLSFENVALDFGCLSDAMETPLYAPLVLGQSWDSAYIDCGGMDGEEYRVSYLLGYGEDELTVETWFRNGTPVRGEIYDGGELLLSASVENFTFGV